MNYDNNNPLSYQSHIVVLEREVKLGQRTPTDAATALATQWSIDWEQAYRHYFKKLWPDYERATGGR